jgi:hypothetical protein
VQEQRAQAQASAFVVSAMNAATAICVLGVVLLVGLWMYRARRQQQPAYSQLSRLRTPEVQMA